MKPFKEVLREAKDRMAERKVLADCKRGKHRWTEAVNKSEGGVRTAFYFCQTCGVIKEPDHGK